MCHRLDHPNRAYPVRSGERHLRQQPERRRSARKPIRDPYPWMRPKLAEPAALAE
jgi:hypothetical protein